MLGLCNNFLAGFIDLIPGNNGRKGSEVLPPPGTSWGLDWLLQFGDPGAPSGFAASFGQVLLPKALSNRDCLAKLGLSQQGVGASSGAQSHSPAYFPDRRADSERSLGAPAENPHHHLDRFWLFLLLGLCVSQEGATVSWSEARRWLTGARMSENQDPFFLVHSAGVWGTANPSS